MILFVSNADTELLALRSVVDDLPGELGAIRWFHPDRVDGDADARRGRHRRRAAAGRPRRLDASRSPRSPGGARTRGIPLVAARRRGRSRRRAAGRRRPCRPVSPRGAPLPRAPAVRPTSANLVRFLSDTCCMTGFGFDPPDAVPDVGVWDGAGIGAPGAVPATRASARGRRLLPGPPGGREHHLRRATCATRSRPPAPTRSRSGPTRCAATPTARSPRCELCRDHGVDVDRHVDAGGRARRTGDGDGWDGARPRRPRRPGHPGPGLEPVPPRLAGRRRRPHPARRRHRRGDPRVRRPHHRPDVRLQGGRRRRRPTRRRASSPPGPIPSAPRRLARLAVRHARLRRIPPSRAADRRSCCRPTRPTGPGSATPSGLDTPASAIAPAATRCAAPATASTASPTDGDALMDELADRLHLRPAARSSRRRWRLAAGSLPARRLRAWFARCPASARDELERALGTGAGRGLRRTTAASTSPGSTSAACWSPSSRPGGSAPTRSAPTTRPTCRRRTTTWRSTGGSATPASRGRLGCRRHRAPRQARHARVAARQGARPVGGRASPTPPSATCRSSTRSWSTTRARARRPSDAPTPSSSTTCRRR